jgi:cyclohexadienyl dehydratase
MPFVAAAKQRANAPVEDTAQEARVIASGSDLVKKAATKRGVEPPAEARTNAFFRAQIEAAKNVQERAPASTGTSSWALDTELRPAIARISARMAWLLVRLPPVLDRGEVVAKTREALADSSLDAQHIDELARAIAELVSATGPVQ